MHKIRDQRLTASAQAPIMLEQETFDVALSISSRHHATVNARRAPPRRSESLSPVVHEPTL